MRPPAAAAGAAVLALLAGCGTGAADPAAAGGTAMADAGCPPPPAMAEAPERVVTMDGGAAAILRELGLADRVVGTAAPDFFDAFDGEARAELAEIPVLDERQGNREAVVAAEPDLVMGISVYSFGAFDGTPTVQELNDAGIEALTSCPGSGTVTGIGETETFIEHTAEVFGVPERGAELVERIRGQIADAAELHAGRRPVRVLVTSAPAEGGQGFYTLGANSLANGIVTLAGGENIAAGIDRDITEINAEAVAAADPEAVLVVSGFSPLDDAELVDSIRSSPMLAGTAAVRDDRFTLLPQSILLSPSVLNGEAVARLAEALHGGGS
ncbi:ABC transporter substrate-binding protein [Allonocardiopsis opalescens]|uniref:Iron complex transport system substrate-binding protein n=1 Tax=Allonocardiopsis opalescens TaxID=1144618 RepID=A0A2T0Q2N6_9ACTN|nr:ABC transporter substrate-binding protein [Allonocardiopsis opalescens]PRX98054.1 iron complex transport system substrate-binding protein [Allonocardiopsis opalescens]